MERFAHEQEFSAAEYLDKLRRQSDHIMLPAAALTQILARIADIVNTDGGRLSIHYHAVLYQF
jgi:hypothetical protein